MMKTNDTLALSYEEALAVLDALEADCTALDSFSVELGTLSDCLERVPDEIATYEALRDDAFALAAKIDAHSFSITGAMMATILRVAVFEFGNAIAQVVDAANAEHAGDAELFESKRQGSTEAFEKSSVALRMYSTVINLQRAVLADPTGETPLRVMAAAGEGWQSLEQLVAGITAAKKPL